MDLLHLPGLRLIRSVPVIGARGRRYNVYAEQVGPPPACCGNVSRNGRRSLSLRDTPANGGPTRLMVSVQRWFCDGCKRSLEAPLPARDPDHRVTRRLAWLAFAMSCERPFAEVARDLNVSTNVVRAIFWRTAHQADALLSPTAPRILGIDEVHLPRQTCAVFVDAETGAVVDLLPSYSRAAVAEGIQRLAGFESIEAITMDFAGAYAAAVRDVYGDAAPPIVLDKRHVLEVARRAMDSVRKEKRRRMKPGRRREIARLMNARRPTLLEDDRQQLERVLRAHPDLRAAHDLKERFYSIFERSDRATAERAFDVWSDSIPADLEETFRPVANVVTQRRQDVFAAFDWPGVTNARTENLNGRLKELHRRVRGYDVDGFEAFRLLALHKLGERQPDVVAERFAAQAILDGRAPWRERTEEELEALLAQAADKIDSGR